MDSQGVYLCRIFLKFFFQTCISLTMIDEKFQIHGVKITGKYICESKNWIWSFLLMHSSKTFLQIFIITNPRRSNLPVSSKQRFLKIYFSPAERGEDYGAEKIIKIKLARILVTSFDKFHHFCNLYIFGFCFVVP